LDNPLVSIIIPTHNSEKTIALCLKSIQNQTYKPIETIVVDKQSQDKTVEIAKKFKTTIKILSKQVERSIQKNYGAKIAKGIYILFLDSDMELTSTVIEECVQKAIHKKVEAIIIPQTSAAKNFLAKCKKAERNSYIGNKLVEAPRFFKKEIFLKIGGYDKNLIFGEDTDLSYQIQKKGYKIGKIQSKIIHHEENLTFKTITLKAYYYGKNLPKFIRKNPNLFLQKYSPINQWYTKLILKDPIHFLGLTLIKMVEYIAYLTGIIFYLLKTNLT